MGVLSEDGEDRLRLLYLRYIMLHCFPFAAESAGGERTGTIWRATNIRSSSTG
jgi:hypothetical protein